MQGEIIVKKIQFLSKALIIWVLIISLLSCLEANESTNNFIRAEKALSSGKHSDAIHYYDIHLEEESDPDQRYITWERLLYIHLDIDQDIERSLGILRNMSFEFRQDRERIWDIYNRIGLLYARLRQFQNSLETHKRASEAAFNDATLVESYMNIAQTYVYMREYNAAAATLQRIIKNDMQADKYLIGKPEYLLGKIYLRQNDFDKAEYYLQKAYYSWADDNIRSMAGIMLLDVYLLNEQVDSAKKILMELKEIYPNPLVMKMRLDGIKRVDQDD